jgi:hypothetical protein
MKLNAWPVAITIFIGALIAGVIAFAVFAFHHRVDLVAPDYYDQEIRYQQHIDGSRRALRLTGGPITKLEGRTARLAIPNHSGATGTVQLYRPSDARLDQTLTLNLDAEGRQELDLSKLTPGPWRIRITWVVSNETFIVESLSVLEPN